MDRVKRSVEIENEFAARCNHLGMRVARLRASQAGGGPLDRLATEESAGSLADLCGQKSPRGRFNFGSRALAARSGWRCIRARGSSGYDCRRVRRVLRRRVFSVCLARRGGRQRKRGAERQEISQPCDSERSRSGPPAIAPGKLALGSSGRRCAGIAPLQDRPATNGGVPTEQRVAPDGRVIKAICTGGRCRT